MYRTQPSATSAKSAFSFYGLQSGGQPQNSPHVAANNNSKPLDTDELSPDELFTRHTVFEVKGIQQRLRHDAEVKQEELRLMVGERYRDLIQASTSIISMGASAKRVLSAFEESKGAILAQHEPPLSSHPTTLGGVNDQHLHALQTLSAHLKVLLDAPEHLWRFIEKKKYLSAAWLFLFIRVVHRGLVQQDDDEDESWTKVGIDVRIEFPLVQRQWDEVSSFRSQIIHKATLSLRELGASTNDICSTLTALHLSDSRPLKDTFAALLTQRTKALSPLMSWRAEHKPQTLTNGLTTDDGSALNRSGGRVRSVNEILQASKDILNTIINTITTAREIYEVPPGKKRSLITSVLYSIQSDSSVDDAEDSGELPADLTLSTRSLLINSTSSAHFLLLPANLQSYRPYVDLSSASANYSQVEFQQTLEEWLHRSSKSWQDASDAWFTNLANVPEVWRIRNALRKQIQASDLKPSEKTDLCKVLDNLCRSRILVVWKEALETALASFNKELVLFISNGRDDSSDAVFKAPRPPALSSQVSKTLDPVPFRRYQDSLKHHLLGRTAQLDTVLNTIEQCARSIQKDLEVALSDSSEDGKSFGQSLVDAYQPEAESTADGVATTLEESVESAIGNPDINGLVGLANVADDLASSSIFVTHIGCRRNVIQKFRSRVDLAFDRIVQEWRERTIDEALEPFDESLAPTIPSQALGPSPRLFQSLMALSGALRDLGIKQECLRHQPIVRETLKTYIQRYLEDGPRPPSAQDLGFLKVIANTYGTDWEELIAAVSTRMGQLELSQSELEESEQVATEHLTRAQTLLSTLLPCASRLKASLSTNTGVNQAHFMLFNTPSSKQEYQSALEIAKPSPRFGLLLVSSAENP